MYISFIKIVVGNWSEGFRGLAALPEQKSKYIESLNIAVQYAKKLNVQKVSFLCLKSSLESFTISWKSIYFQIDFFLRFLKFHVSSL